MICSRDKEFVRRILKEWRNPPLRGGSIGYYSRFYVESWISRAHSQDQLSAMFAEPSLEELAGIENPPGPHRKTR